MNFDCIEGLSEEDIQELFEQEITDSGNSNLADCCCKYAAGTFVNWYGRGNFNAASCNTWCRGNGLICGSWSAYVSACSSAC